MDVRIVPMLDIGNILGYCQLLLSYCIFFKTAAVYGIRLKTNYHMCVVYKNEKG